MRQALARFAAERDWEQFHSPKNLAMALGGEVGELLAELQWLSPAEAEALTQEQNQRVRDELADVLIYLVRLADTLDVDLLSAASDKLAANAEKYPVDLAKGRSTKYSDL